MNAIGTDQDVPGRGLSVGEANGRATCVLFETDTGIARKDRIRISLAHGIQQHGVKVAPVHHLVGRAETLLGRFANVQ